MLIVKESNLFLVQIRLCFQTSSGVRFLSLHLKCSWLEEISCIVLTAHSLVSSSLALWQANEIKVSRSHCQACFPTFKDKHNIKPKPTGLKLTLFYSLPYITKKFRKEPPKQRKEKMRKRWHTTYSMSNWWLEILKKDNWRTRKSGDGQQGGSGTLKGLVY